MTSEDISSILYILSIGLYLGAGSSNLYYLYDNQQTLNSDFIKSWILQIAMTMLQLPYINKKYSDKDNLLIMPPLIATFFSVISFSLFIR